MSGRCVPPVYGSFSAHTSPGARSSCLAAATASGIAPRWTGMCSACAIIRPPSSKSAVEQSRRSLMFAEKAERIRTTPISSAIDRSAAPSTCSSTGMECPAFFTKSSPTREHPEGTIPNPLPPGGKPDRRPVQFDRGRAGRGLPRQVRTRRRRTWQLELRPRDDVRCVDRDELDLPLRLGVAVALLVRSVERGAEVRLQRHAQLERLTAIAQVGLAVKRELARLVERAEIRADVVSPLV